MDTVAFSTEQFSQLLEHLFIYVFMAVLAAFVVWGAVGFLLRRLCLILRARQLKWLRDNPQN